MLASISSVMPETRKGRRSDSPTRIASCSAVTASAWLRRIANSSPPSRATSVLSVANRARRSPTWRSSWSPAKCPSVSFTSLNSFRSIRISAIASPFSRMIRRWASSRSSTRLGSPVSASWRARYSVSSAGVARQAARRLARACGPAAAGGAGAAAGARSRSPSAAAAATASSRPAITISRCARPASGGFVAQPQRRTARKRCSAGRAGDPTADGRHMAVARPQLGAGDLAPEASALCQHPPRTGRVLVVEPAADLPQDRRPLGRRLPVSARVVPGRRGTREQAADHHNDEEAS